MMPAELFKYLEKRKIPYCVMGRTDKFPKIIESDIDIVISGEQIAVLSKTMSDFCAMKGARIVQHIQHEQTAHYFVISLEGNFRKPEFLIPDICSDYFRNGRLFLLAEEILADRAPATARAPAAPRACAAA